MGSREVAEVARQAYWRAEDARVVVEAWRREGGPLSRFARRHGIHPHRLARWVAKLDRIEHPMRFHAVQVARTDAGRDGAIEIELSRGRRVRVARGFEADDLRRVLAVLGENATC